MENSDWLVFGLDFTVHGPLPWKRAVSNLIIMIIMIIVFNNNNINNNNINNNNNNNNYYYYYYSKTNKVSIIIIITTITIIMLEIMEVHRFLSWLCRVMRCIVASWNTRIVTTTKRGPNA